MRLEPFEIEDIEDAGDAARDGLERLARHAFVGLAQPPSQRGDQLDRFFHGDLLRLAVSRNRSIDLAMLDVRPVAAEACQNRLARLGMGRGRPGRLLDLHGYLGTLACVFVGVHVLGILFDGVVQFLRRAACRQPPRANDVNPPP